MSAITAAAVKELREITGVAMMDCKKALVECNGDLEEAKEFLKCMDDPNDPGAVATRKDQQLLLDGQSSGFSEGYY